MRRYRGTTKAEVRRRMRPARGSDFSRSGHSHHHPQQLVECLANARRGGAGIREGTWGLDRWRHFTVVMESAGLNGTEISA